MLLPHGDVAQGPTGVGLPWNEVLRLLPSARVVGGSPRTALVGIATHTRDVRPGTLFACLPGTSGDGHRFGAIAQHLGACALLVERFLPECAELPQIEVRDARSAVALLARALHGFPDRHLHLIAVTGTNGKTTTTFLIEAIFRAAGMPLGLLGTVAYKLGSREIPASLTTPDAVHLASYLAEIRGVGLHGAVLEASSHALAQGRISGFEIDTAIFTNLARDHWDYHGGALPYFQAKKRLFEPRGGHKPFPALAVVCVDQWAGRELARQVAPYRQVATFGLQTPADFTARWQPLPTGGLLVVRSGQQIWPFVVPLLGEYNAQNALAAVTTALVHGIEPEAIARGLATVPPVPGRMEAIDGGQPFAVLVDFAHNPAGLLQALRVARAKQPRRLILVFGCKGGDGDAVKRRLMGRVAAQGADLVLLTTDDPYGEDPGLIATEVARGLEGTATPYRVILDRREAIEEAIATAAEGDLVLVAGRGHEAFQPVADGKAPLDDRAVCREAIAQRTGSRHTPAMVEFSARGG